jgi:hypothetical protein
LKLSIKAALRTFRDEVHRLLAVTTSTVVTDGSIVQILAGEQLGKLMETVRSMLIA